MKYACNTSAAMNHEADSHGKDGRQPVLKTL